MSRLVDRLRDRVRARVAAPRQRQLLGTIGTVVLGILAGLLLFIAARES